MMLVIQPLPMDMLDPLLRMVNDPVELLCYIFQKLRANYF